jgi:hypothetical protein
VVIIIRALRSIVEFDEQPEQLASQRATVPAEDPSHARSIEHLGDWIRGRNYL